MEKIIIILENRFSASKRKRENIRVEIDYNEKFGSILKKYAGTHLTIMDPKHHILYSFFANDTPNSGGFEAGQEYRMMII